MMLLVDMGNSSIKWAIFDQDGLGSQERLSYQSDNLNNLLTQAWQMLNIPSGVWVSNVAGSQKAEILSHWVKFHWGLKPTFLKTARGECGIKNGYQNPEQLGVDRWLALIGAYQLETGPLCVVDCGTAVTLDVLSADGYHQGGLILPGVTTMYNALKMDTYALEPHLTGFENLSGVVEKLFLAHDTQMGITLGTLYAIMGLLEYVINTLEKSGKKVILILTGGSAYALEPLLQRPYLLRPDLVLQGLSTVVKQSL